LVRIRKASLQDVDAILGIQNRIPNALRWQEADYTQLVSDPGGLLLVAEFSTSTTPKVMGYSAFRRIIDEAELLNIGVDPEHQQQGVGKALLVGARSRLMESGARRVFLEVRVSNRAALHLYSSLGFTLYQLRKDYYHDPEEDAYVMCMEITPPKGLEYGA
jgi:[ribosomal protein S18]-alanine N-acetyltransferase